MGKTLNRKHTKIGIGNMTLTQFVQQKHSQPAC